MSGLPEYIASLCEVTAGGSGRITDKHSFQALAERRVLGNTARGWRTLDDLLNSRYSGKIHIRYSSPQSSFIRENVPVGHIERTVKELEAAGADRKCMRFSESLPAEEIVISGVVARSESYFDLFFTREKLSLREAQDKSLLKIATGLFAYGMLKAHMCPASFEDLNTIFDLFPDSMVEFTVYRHDTGIVPGRNTIIWEVRNY